MGTQVKGSALQTKLVEFGDAVEPLIQIKFRGEGNATIAVDADGDTSKLLITLVAGGVTTTIDGATYTTLGLVLDAINAVSGFYARRYNGAYDLSTDSDNFIDAPATSIPITWTNALYRDASEYTVWTARLSNPETDKLGRIQLQALRGSITGTGTLTLKVFQDQGSDTAKRVWQYIGTITTATATEFLNLDVDATYEFAGPLRIEAEAGTAITGVDLTAVWRPVN